ncbi:S41 family peptidase [Aureitalea sp. L0-47]|uniref:S41 family peptidase n=1 Tax=Aureitalea sp. L0-47 TaxID=2816962 RepID=UPI002237AF56|nr:S41 family peptidase [Aureitalea sp. L0-47]MCW5520232.1 S41 family peptidase [Aureitalea sp. L0-47]
MKIYNTLTLVLTGLIILMAASCLQAQNTPVTSAEKALVIDSVSSKLNSNYVFPEVAKKMSADLQSKLKSGAYNTISDPNQFATKLTEDLQAISKDKHLRVSFAPQQIQEQEQTVSPEDSIKFMNRWINQMKRNNFGFKKVKIMDGNIGYLDLRSFSNVEFAGPTAVAAMNYLSNSDAIIIDLRKNGGGSPAMIQLISSYLFGSEPVHLNNFYWRPSDETTQTWTLPHVSGERSPDTPVYVLTSSSTFSAAEEFSYNLKNLDRATLVGETTGGGAHPGGSRAATDRFMVWLPIGRAINPITNTNWEGTGVSPHIEVPSQDALDVAYVKALESLKEKHKDDEEMATYYEWPMVALKVQQNPVSLDTKTLKKYAGSYGPRNVMFENGKLYYQRGTNPKYELYPYSDNEFMLKGLETFRIRFLSENNKVVALQGLYDNGQTDKNLRD